jgi:hypothetical protein
MQGWTLDYVRGLDASDYEEIINWLNDEAERARGDRQGSVDMDALIADRRGPRGEDD